MQHKMLAGLVVTLLLMALPVSAAIAEGGPTEVAFSATADLQLTSTVATQPTPAGIITAQEALSGPITSSDWDALSGAYMSTNHNSRVALSGYAEGLTAGTVSGTLWGYLSVSSPQGGQTNGRFDATITGTWALVGHTADGQPIISANIHNVGSWLVGAGSGVFAGAPASGDWSGDFSGILGVTAQYGGLSGQATFTGTHK